eukprot:TRINITY_DN4294_c0_g1_i9.p1 TRINITY_DN4294_c0_g1~~TRINITY_DN4294_c0_g1_i9.p1  ORF type:complete len:280 (+),score=57.09 TRINITY_DN4294_c0_g1_i9:77-916(+)
MKNLFWLLSVDLAEWLVVNQYATTQNEAITFAKILMDGHVFVLLNGHEFKSDPQLFCRFTHPQIHGSNTENKEAMKSSEMLLSSSPLSGLSSSTTSITSTNSNTSNTSTTSTTSTSNTSTTSTTPNTPKAHLSSIDLESLSQSCDFTKSFRKEKGLKFSFWFTFSLEKGINFPMKGMGYIAEITTYKKGKIESYHWVTPRVQGSCGSVNFHFSVEHLLKMKDLVLVQIFVLKIKKNSLEKVFFGHVSSYVKDLAINEPRIAQLHLYRRSKQLSHSVSSG